MEDRTLELDSEHNPLIWEMGEFVFFLHLWYCLVFCFKRISLGWVLFCLRGLELLANLDEDCRHSLEHFIIMSYGGLHLNIREQQI